jgi:hypothetical protein
MPFDAGLDIAARRSIVVSMEVQFVLLDTNAMSALLKNDPERRLNELGWRIYHHPLNEAELSACHLLPDCFALMSRTKEDGRHSKYFIGPMDPNEYLKEQVENNTTDGFTNDYFEYVVDKLNTEYIHSTLPAETKKWADFIKLDMTEIYKAATQATGKDKRLHPKAKALKQAKLATLAELEKRGFDVPVKDPFRFPSLLSKNYARFEKYISKTAELNDEYDLTLFYLVPFVDVFVTEKNNAHIASQIKQHFSAKGLAFPAIIKCEKFEKWCETNGSPSALYSLRETV